jgi:hypothetical protein
MQRANGITRQQHQVAKRNNPPFGRYVYPVPNTPSFTQKSRPSYGYSQSHHLFILYLYIDDEEADYNASVDSDLHSDHYGYVRSGILYDERKV